MKETEKSSVTECAAGEGQGWEEEEAEDSSRGGGQGRADFGLKPE